MFENIEFIVRTYICPPKRAEIFFIYRKGSAHEVWVKYMKLIAAKKINIKWGDIIYNSQTGLIYPHALAFIYDGQYLIDIKKYYKGNFRIWECHPTAGFFINSHYWSDIFSYTVFFDYRSYKLEHLNLRFNDHIYRVKINGNIFYIDRHSYLRRIIITSNRFHICQDNGTIMLT